VPSVVIDEEILPGGIVVGDPRKRVFQQPANERVHETGGIPDAERPAGTNLHTWMRERGFYVDMHDGTWIPPSYWDQQDPSERPSAGWISHNPERHLIRFRILRDGGGFDPRVLERVRAAWSGVSITPTFHFTEARDVNRPLAQALVDEGLLTGTLKECRPRFASSAPEVVASLGPPLYTLELDQIQVP
jgi:hypothetical protein